MIQSGFPNVFAACASVALTVAALAACGGPGAITGSSVATYNRANAIVTAGYSERAIDDAHYEVRANGTQGTPKSRVEKIAMARAAEIGVESKFRWFKVVDIRHGVQCGKQQDVYKGKPQPAFHYPTVTMDVVYAKGATPPDPAYQPAAESHTRLAGELASETFDPAETAAAATEVKAQCTKT